VKIDGLNWYCLVCVPQKEYITEHILQQIGIAPSIFVPSEVKYPRINRRRQRHSKTAASKKYPLLGSRYIFIGCDEPLPAYRLSRIHLVTGIVAKLEDNHYRPAKFPVEAIKRLDISQNSAIMRKSTPNPHKSFQAGDHVDVVIGPFTGYHLMIKDVRGRFAQFAIEIFGKRQLLEVPLSHLESSL